MREYCGVRKMVWDELWHAIYKDKDGNECYDRVNLKTARKIIFNITKKQHRERLRERV